MNSSEKYPKPLEVRISETAELRIIEILKYVELKWGTKSKTKLLNAILKGFSQVSIFQKSGKVSKIERNTYQLVINKQTSFYYEIQDDTVFILTVFDNRLDEMNR